MKLAQILQVASAVPSIWAALFWWRSALVKLPDRFTSGYGGVGGSAQVMFDALKEQSRLSKLAAAGAVLAALLQALAAVILI